MIHEFGWPDENAVLSMQSDPGCLGIEPGLQAKRNMAELCQSVQKPKPGIVPGFSIFWARITQTGDHE
jgi:hypothetical protein